jgi:hypothetical protein
LAVIQHLFYAAFDGSADTVILGLKINKLHVFLIVKWLSRLRPISG